VPLGTAVVVMSWVKLTNASASIVPPESSVTHPLFGVRPTAWTRRLLYDMYTAVTPSGMEGGSVNRIERVPEEIGFSVPAPTGANPRNVAARMMMAARTKDAPPETKTLVLVFMVGVCPWFDLNQLF